MDFHNNILSIFSLNLVTNFFSRFLSISRHLKIPAQNRGWNLTGGNKITLKQSRTDRPSPFQILTLSANEAQQTRRNHLASYIAYFENDENWTRWPGEYRMHRKQIFPRHPDFHVRPATRNDYYSK